ncbi:MAG: phenylalanine--tRNA ligase subunit beta [Crocinitomicaceae bacterium]
MKISLNWLKHYISLDINPEEICEILTDTGLEVEGLEKVESIKGGLEGLVIGEVLTKQKHPDADRLNITTVNIGGEEPLQIVCGAPNVETGQKVVIATVGTILYPSPEESFKIKKSKIRGVESIGMICAEDEIGLGKSHDGIMVLPAESKVGQTAKSYFKVEDDYLIEIGLTPNRADAMGHIGVARDLKAFLNFHKNQDLLIKHPEKSEINYSGSFKVNIENESHCPRYAYGILKNIKIGPSPDWMQNILKTIGIKPINNVVDITNFVMHEMGQPLHAFDLEKVGDNVRIRSAKKGEKFTTLDGVERELHAEDMVIANQSEVMCLAGVFGGEDSGVSDNTTSLFLESAYFNTVTVRKGAKRHGLNTDSSFRFERGVDPNLIKVALERAVFLLKSYAGAELVEANDQYPKSINPWTVAVDFDRCRKLIGVDISNDDIITILNQLDIDLVSQKGALAEVKIPTYRVDVTREADVVEEILRIYGFNNVSIPAKLNSSISYETKPNKDKLYNITADLLVSQGYYEIMSNSLTASKHIEKSESDSLKMDHNVSVLNPLSIDLDIMRQTIMFGGLETIAYNQNRQNPNLRLFEFGKVYQKFEGKYEETEKLGIWLTGRKYDENWASHNENHTYFSLNGITESILSRLGLDSNSRTGSVKSDLFEDGVSIIVGKKTVGDIGWIKSSLLKQFGIKNQVFFADLNWGDIVELQFMNKTKYKPLPKTQFVRRDFSLLLDDSVKFSDIEAIAKKADRKILKNVGLFDVYEGKKLEKGKKSYAVNFIFQDHDETLKDKEVDKIMDSIREKLETELLAELR